ncbi:MAG: hypothetical protein KGL39_12280 [Patescibacteria group bacterium]|nr:hypothetical protein [Patescibacteria group bacterium]
MSNELITEEEVERALTWLRDSATEIGEAKAYAVKTEKMVKHTKAILMKKHAELGIGAQEREAYADDLYVAAVDAEATAAGEYEKMKALREAAAMRIDCWRSMSANYRSMKI